MKNHSINNAAKPNPALEPFKKLIGEWKTEGTHPALSGIVLHGHSSFSQMEGGAFLIWHSTIEQKDFPDGVAIFGSDDSAKTYYMLYFDERNVSRKYDVSFENNCLKWWRDESGFSQRYSWTFSEDDNTMIGKGELCKDGKNWEKDLDLTYTRVK